MTKRVYLEFSNVRSVVSTVDESTDKLYLSILIIKIIFKFQDFSNKLLFFFKY